MYIVEGNIGVGKSTFLKQINDLIPELDIIPEPLENWTNHSYGQSLLTEFYNDIPRWAYTLETLALICRVRDHVRESKNPYPHRLMERSIYSGHYCFAKNDYANKNLTDMEWSLYSEWVNFMIKQQCTPPLGFVYLKANPEVCYDRVLKRNRESEKSLTLEYINQIHHWHEKFLGEKEDLFESIQQVPVLVLDCNESFVKNPSVMQNHVEKIRDFLAIKDDVNVEKSTINALTY